MKMKAKPLQIDAKEALELTSDHELYFIGDRIREIPSGYEQVTVPLDVSSELSLIRTIFDTLRNTEALASVSNGAVVFWRLRNNGRHTARERNRRSYKNFARAVSA
jgi:hypothetical protein